jgi:hypothetical protein
VTSTCEAIAYPPSEKPPTSKATAFPGDDPITICSSGVQLQTPGNGYVQAVCGGVSRYRQRLDIQTRRESDRTSLLPSASPASSAVRLPVCPRVQPVAKRNADSCPGPRDLRHRVLPRPLRRTTCHEEIPVPEGERA